MRIVKIFIVAALFLPACAQKQDARFNTEAAIINDVFMDIVDTVAYRYHSLRPAPNFDVFTDNDSLNVAIAPVLSNIRERQADIYAIKDVTPEDRKTIEALFNKSKIDSVQSPLPWEQVTKTGRYRLFPHSKPSVSIDTLSAIGKVLFSRVYYNEKQAVVIATIRDQVRVGIVKLFLLEKTATGWRKKQEYVLEVN